MDLISCSHIRGAAGRRVSRRSQTAAGSFSRAGRWTRFPPLPDPLPGAAHPTNYCRTRSRAPRHPWPPQPGHNPEPATENGKRSKPKRHLRLRCLPSEAFNCSANSMSTCIWTHFFLLHTSRFLSLQDWSLGPFPPLNLFLTFWGESVIILLSSMNFVLLFQTPHYSQQEHEY